MDDSMKFKVGIAENEIHKFPRKSQHVTTRNFMQFNVAHCLEMPKSSLSATHKTFIRTMAMKRPLLSNINIHKHAYFVPYRVCWPAFIDFRTDTPHNTSSGTLLQGNTPTIVIEDLLMAFTNQLCATSVNSGIVDFTSINHSDPTQMADYRFTSFGRWAYKLFCSMGLSVPFLEYSKETVSALPLLAVAKCYIDWFFPNQYAHYGLYATLDGYFHRQFIYSLNEQDILNILQAIYLVSYDSDYFTSAFDKPVLGASSVQSTDFNIKDISLPDVSDASRSAVSQYSNVSSPLSEGTPILTRSDSVSNATQRVTQNILRQLDALTNYITRHSLSGSRALERYVADWGVALDADKLTRCYKLGEQVFPLEVGEVMSQSDTLDSINSKGASLGDYAGRAVAFDGSFKFDVDTLEDGLLIVVDTVVPSVSYVQGIMRYWFHKTKLDFLNGDFDGISMREIKTIELFAGCRRQLANGFSGIFGFCPQYAEYKTPRFDLLSGDFRVNSKNVGLQGFESARMFSDKSSDSVFNLVHDIDFVLGNDFDQYNRIFMDDEDDADKFICIHRLEFEQNIGAKPLYDLFPFDDAKKHVKLSINGVKDN